MIRRSLIQQNQICYRENVRIAEDFLFYSELLLGGGKFGTCELTEYCYAVRPQSLSRPKRTRVFDIIRANNILIGLLRLREEPVASPLINRLERRSSAFWYEQFARSIKTADLPGVIQALYQGSSGYFWLRIVQALKLRVARWMRSHD